MPTAALPQHPPAGLPQHPPADLPSIHLLARLQVKNISGLRFLNKAIDYEIGRQIATLASGRAVLPETRTFDPTQNVTIVIRGKEDDVEYRYMPEPDLLPLLISDAMLEAAHVRRGGRFVSRLLQHVSRAHVYTLCNFVTCPLFQDL
jgi:hypothetical protein